MRILWFSTNSSSYISGDEVCTSTYGSWMSSLQDELKKRTGINLGICFCMEGQPTKVEQAGVTYYPIPAHKKTMRDKIIDLLHPTDVRRDEILWPYYIEQFQRVIEDFRPDVIEVFGSELYMGLSAIVARDMHVPFVLHLQGLLSLYIYILLPPGMSRWQYIWRHRSLRRAYGNYQELLYWNRSCHREKTILQACSDVIGRTEWDKNAFSILNPKARYHYGGEILRPEFYEPADRNPSSVPLIVTTISRPTYKGLDLLLKVAQILKCELHLDFTWNIYGNVESDYADRLTGIWHEDVNVHLCGVATARNLREALLSSVLYFHPSYIENSSNSVCEAQMTEIPVVTTNVGGTSSLVEHGRTGFLFPATDPYMGAYYVKRLIEDKNLNISMGQEAHRVAQQRHDKGKIIESLLSTYANLKENGGIA